MKSINFSNKLLVDFAVFLLRSWKKYCSPLIGPRCRFLPTCSEYAIGAIQKYGLVRGSYLAIKRLLRCHPWGGSGLDPVP